MTRRSIYIACIIGVIAIVVFVTPFLWFHGAVSKSTQLPSTETPPLRLRSGPNHFVIQPVVGDHYWSLVNVKEREASSDINRALDWPTISGIAGGKAINVPMEFSLEIRGGLILPNIYTWSLPGDTMVEHNIFEVFNTFSGDYSSWANVTLEVQIDFRTRRVNVRFKDFQIDPEKVAEVKAAAACNPIDIKFFPSDRPETLIARRGFQIGWWE